MLELLWTSEEARWRHGIAVDLFTIDFAEGPPGKDSLVVRLTLGAKDRTIKMV